VALVTLWTDWGWPSYHFHVFLTGYDVTQLNLYDVLTAAPIPADQLARMQNAHAGFEVAGFGGCLGDRLNGRGDCAGGCPASTIARGYATIDSVSQVSDIISIEPGYFIQGGLGIANNENVLWGDFFLLDPASQIVATNPLVHIEADESLGLGFGGPNAETGYTFYGRHFDTLGGFRGADNREPLASSWSVRYFNAFDTTDFIVWRDTTDQPITGTGFACGLCRDGAGPHWCPLGQTQVVCFDEAGDLVELCGGEGCFPSASQRVPAAELGIPFDQGWCFLNLNHDCDKCFPGGGPWPPGGGDLAQSYVLQLHTSPLGLAGSLPAVEVAGTCEPSDVVVP
jgi:hypothetical protein